MAPKKPTVTSSSTRSARVKSGSNPVVTQGAARNRTARTTLGPAPKQRPLATGGTKGPLQGGTRSPSLKMNPTKMEAGPGKVGPNLGQQTTTSSAGRRGPRPPSENRIRSMEAGPAKVTGNQGQQSTASSAGRRGPRPAPQSPKASGITMSGDKQAAIKGANNPAGPRAPKPAWGPVPTATEARNARNAANRAAKGYGKPSALETNIRNTVGTIKSAAQLASRGGALAAGLQAYNTGAGTLTANAPKIAKQISAMKNKVGPKVVGPKKVGPAKVGTIAQSFDKSFAAARKAGKSEFTFKGKKYNTKMA